MSVSPVSQAPELSEASLDNLYASGLTDETLVRAEIHESLTVAGADRAAYGIPYFDIHGRRISYERIRLLPGGAQRYKQPPNSPNRVYLPPQLSELAPNWHKDTTCRLVITEGEKKALAAAQAGTLCLGLGGVDNWVNRTKFIPVDALQKVDEVGKGKRRGIIVKLSSDRAIRDIDEAVAPELLEIDWRNRQVLLAYDTPDSYTKEGVQRAAFQLGQWLRQQGARVGIFYLDPREDGEKVGLDDWLLDDPSRADQLLNPPPCPFPPPPDPRNWLRHLLDQPVSRAIQEEAAVGILAALDQRGDRYKDDRGLYYYEKGNKHLHSFDFNDKALYRSSFGTLLNDLGLRTADQQIMSRLANVYATETPIADIRAHRVLARKSDALYVQLSDGEMLRITRDDISVQENGTDGTLFVAGSVEPANADKLTALLAAPPRKPHLWFDAVSSLRLRPLEPLTIEETRILLTTTFYLSPWLWRWRGMQLPLETVIAEAGAGKTFLYNLRMEVLTGNPTLGHAPTDMKDFAAQVSSAPGIWVCDNLGKLSSETFHRLSDEIARLITEPNPAITMRELFTTAGLATIPVECTFAITAIKAAFTAPDITQRTLLFHLDAIPPGERDPDWYNKQLTNGREEWLVEHARALQRFLQLAEREWDNPMPQQHRLAYFERGLVLMGRALGFPASTMMQIRAKLAAVADVAVAETNPFIEALITIREEWRSQKRTSLQAVVDFVKFDPEERFVALNQFSNSRQLGNAFRANPAQIQRSTGITTDTRHNQTWVIFP